MNKIQEKDIDGLIDYIVLDIISENRLDPDVDFENPEVIKEAIDEVINYLVKKAEEV